MTAVVEAVVPGRTANARKTNEEELNGVQLIRMHVEHASAKARTSPPKDDKADLEDAQLTAKTWTGVVPIKRVALEPVPTSGCKVSMADLPEHVRSLN